ncbi:MAG TPA: DapH/DapD/GlmU-related protein, partial [bacterium]|nr:DapH/DapD/GlmU-related protein [bacterium]
VGDAFIGENVNIGCGVITCNYDGFKKSITNVGDNAFVGSDCQLVAPVNISKNSYVAAGTTVTKDVPEDALALSRTPQKHIEGYVKKVREKNSKK